MLHWLKSLFKAPEPAGPPQTIRKLGTSDQTISQELRVSNQNAWQAELKGTQTLRLFEASELDVEQCLLT